jgi:hypothetical protein
VAVIFQRQLVRLDPALELKEIQGNILAGFHKDYASFCSLRFRLTRPTHVRGCMAAWSSSASPSTSWIDFRWSFAKACAIGPGSS